MSAPEFVWFASYRRCNCTFLGKELDSVPKVCAHQNGLLGKPELTPNRAGVPLGMECENTRQTA